MLIIAISFYLESELFKLNDQLHFLLQDNNYQLNFMAIGFKHRKNIKEHRLSGFIKKFNHIIIFITDIFAIDIIRNYLSHLKKVFQKLDTVVIIVIERNSSIIH